MIYRTYRYLFYWTYLSAIKGWGRKGYPEQWAMIRMCFLFLINFSSLLMIGDIFFGKCVLAFVVDNKRIFYVFLIAILVVHYFMFIHKAKYKKIFLEFRYFSKKERKKRMMVVNVIYPFLSFFMYGFWGLLAILCNKYDFSLIGFFRGLIGG